MATPNYGYEKRQRELAKKQKKEDKLRAKSQKATGGGRDGLSADAQGLDRAADAGSSGEGAAGPVTGSAS